MKTKVQPELLRWSRERAGLSVPDVARKLGKSEDAVSAWESTGQISLGQAEQLAHVTHIPFGYLFLPEPPEERLPVRDFRTAGGQGVQRPSPDLLDVINDALSRQEWYRDHLLMSGEEALPFVGSLSLSTDVNDAAARIRAVVHWDSALRTAARTWEIALSQQAELLEEAQILVMRSGIVGNNTHRPLAVEEFRGFALSDPYAPLIFINSRDSKAAQMFTLAHELVHIWVGLSGVSNLDQTYTRGDAAEHFCNAVAAELLVPASDLRARWPEVKESADPIAVLVNRFKVSSLVILRRLHDLGYLSDVEFEQRYREQEQAFGRTNAAGGGGNFYRTLRTRLGRRFVSALVASTLEGRTLYRDAFRLLGVSNAEAVRKLAEDAGVIA